jgi:hypothetical protein
MSINPISCTSTAKPNAIALLWLCGVMLGVVLTLLSIQVYGQVHRSRQRKHQMEEEATLLRRKQQEEMALLQRRQQEEEVDHLMDERMLCSACWQERHPGMLFPFPGLRHCRKHAHWLLLENAANAGVIGQQSSINQIDSINQYKGMEMCA